MRFSVPLDDADVDSPGEASSIEYEDEDASQQSYMGDEMEAHWVYGYDTDDAGTRKAWRGAYLDDQLIAEREYASHTTEPTDGTMLHVAHFLDGTSNSIPGMVPLAKRTAKGRKKRFGDKGSESSNKARTNDNTLVVTKKTAVPMKRTTGKQKGKPPAQVPVDDEKADVAEDTGHGKLDTSCGEDDAGEEAGKPPVRRKPSAAKHAVAASKSTPKAVPAMKKPCGPRPVQTKKTAAAVFGEKACCGAWRTRTRKR